MAYEVTINGVTKVMSENEYRTTDIDTITSVRLVPVDNGIRYTSLDLDI